MFIRFFLFFPLIFLSHLGMAQECSFDIYDSDQLNYQTKPRPISIMNNGIEKDFWQAEIQDPLYSDHELIIAENEGTRALSYNIMYQMFRRHDHYNNAFLLDNEKPAEYLKRLDRILTRLSHATDNDDIDFIFLQESPFEKQSLNYFKKQMNHVLPEFQIYSQGNALTLFKKTLQVIPLSDFLNDQLTPEEQHTLSVNRLSPYWLPEKNLVVINAHLPWLHKDNAKANDTFHRLIHSVIEKVRMHEEMKDTDIWIMGDWNREDYTLPDRYLTLDIDVVVDNIAPYGTLCKSGHYTNLRVEGEDIPALLTTSDYLLIIPR